MLGRFVVTICVVVAVSAKGKPPSAGGEGESDAPEPAPAASPTTTSAPQTTPTTSTSSADASTTTASASGITMLQLNTPSNATVCQPLMLSWQFAGSQTVALTFTVTPEMNTTSSTLAPAGNPRVIAAGLSATGQQYMWDPVDVSPGSWYLVTAADPTNASAIIPQSAAFFVQQGGDMSCLSSVSATTAASSSNTTSPSSQLRQKSRFTSGDLIGIVIGVVVIIVLGVGAFLLRSRLRAAVSKQKLTATNVSEKRRAT